jgi:putative acetyltransferase
MSRHYASADARYYVVEHDGHVLGGAGFARLLAPRRSRRRANCARCTSVPPRAAARLGHAMLALLLDEMRAAGYRRCYLETTTWMQAAQHLYRQHGFVQHFRAAKAPRATTAATSSTRASL